MLLNMNVFFTNHRETLKCCYPSPVIDRRAGKCSLKTKSVVIQQPRDNVYQTLQGRIDLGHLTSVKLQVVSLFSTFHSKGGNRVQFYLWQWIPAEGCCQHEFQILGVI